MHDVRGVGTTHTRTHAQTHVRTHVRTYARTHANPVHTSVRHAGKMNVLFNDTYIQLRRLCVGRECIMHAAPYGMKSRRRPGLCAVRRPTLQTHACTNYVFFFFLFFSRYFTIIRLQLRVRNAVFGPPFSGPAVIIGSK